MLVLYCGAVVFAWLEDPEVRPSSPQPHAAIEMDTTSNGTQASNVTTTAAVPVSSQSSGTQSSVRLLEEGFILLEERASTFWKELGVKHSLDVSAEAKEEIRKFFTDQFRSQSSGHSPQTTARTVSSTQAPGHNRHDRHYIFAKWFYFATICTTTIGYGGLHPHTSQVNPVDQVEGEGWVDKNPTLRGSAFFTSHGCKL